MATKQPFATDVAALGRRAFLIPTSPKINSPNGIRHMPWTEIGNKTKRKTGNLRSLLGLPPVARAIGPCGAKVTWSSFQGLERHRGQGGQGQDEDCCLDHPGVWADSCLPAAWSFSLASDRAISCTAKYVFFRKLHGSTGQSTTCRLDRSGVARLSRSSFHHARECESYGGEARKDPGQECSSFLALSNHSAGQGSAPDVRGVRGQKETSCFLVRSSDREFEGVGNLARRHRKHQAGLQELVSKAREDITSARRDIDLLNPQVGKQQNVPLTAEEASTEDQADGEEERLRTALQGTLQACAGSLGLQPVAPSTPIQTITSDDERETQPGKRMRSEELPAGGTTFRPRRDRRQCLFASDSEWAWCPFMSRGCSSGWGLRLYWFARQLCSMPLFPQFWFNSLFASPFRGLAGVCIQGGSGSAVEESVIDHRSEEEIVFLMHSAHGNEHGHGDCFSNGGLARLYEDSTFALCVLSMFFLGIVVKAICNVRAGIIGSRVFTRYFAFPLIFACKAMSVICPRLQVWNSGKNEFARVQFWEWVAARPARHFQRRGYCQMVLHHSGPTMNPLACLQTAVNNGSKQLSVRHFFDLCWRCCFTVRCLEHVDFSNIQPLPYGLKLSTWALPAMRWLKRAALLFCCHVWSMYLFVPGEKTYVSTVDPFATSSWCNFTDGPRRSVFTSTSRPPVSPGTVQWRLIPDFVG